MFSEEIVSRKKNILRDGVKEEKYSPRRWCQGRKVSTEEMVSRKKSVHDGDSVNEEKCSPRR